MDIEEQKKEKIFNNSFINKIKEKRKYFRIEKIPHNPKLIYKESKQIFRTKKDYHLLKLKAIREFKRIKIKKYSTDKKNKSNIISLDTDNNSFLIKKVFPKRLKAIEIRRNEFNPFSKLKEKVIINYDNGIMKKPDEIEKKPNYYKNKLMLVYFSSIKNLCKYINKNFFNPSLTDKNSIDDFTNQIYKSLQILDRKIKEFEPFFNLKDNINVHKEDFYDISSLKENLLLMKNSLNNSMSQNLINIYIDVDNFCKLYS